MSLTKYVPSPKYEEYRETFKEHFIMEKRDDGVLLVRMHTLGKEAQWSEELHRAISQMWQTVGADPEIELVIFTGTGEYWLEKIDNTSWLDEVTDPAYTRYEHMYYDGRRMLISQAFNTEIPLIGAINGSGPHMEGPLMCDLCIMAEEAVIIDPHFRIGIVPGDGIQIVLEELMGTRRAQYMMYTNEVITAEKALKYNLVSEIMPREKLIGRAYELADLIMKKSRSIRRLTSSVLRKKWRQLLADNLDGAFGTEMFGDFTVDGLEHASGDAEALYDNTSEVFPDENRNAVKENIAKQQEK